MTGRNGRGPVCGDFGGRNDQGEPCQRPAGWGTGTTGTGTCRDHAAEPQPTPRFSTDAFKRDKVAIVGFTPTRKDAPYHDPDWEIWGLNALYVHKDVKRADRWFDVHPVDSIPAERVKKYREMDIPVYLQEPHPEIPKSVAFPADALRERFGRYWTNSISWEVGLALLEGFRKIHIYGVDLSSEDEYRKQKPNLEYFLGLAQGMGVEVWVPPGSDLLSATHEYGYGTDDGLLLKLDERLQFFQARMKEADESIKKHKAEITRLQSVYNTLDGARQATEWMINNRSVGTTPGASEYHDESGTAAKTAAPAKPQLVGV